MTSAGTHFRPRRGVGTQALLVSAATGLSQLATAIMYIVAARRSQPADFGIVVAAIAAGTTMTGLLDFGSNAYWTREIARGAETGESLGGRASAKLLAGLLAALVIGVGSYAFAPSTQFWVAGLIGCGLLLSQTSRVPLTGSGRAELAAIPLVTDRLLAAGVVVILTEAGVTGPTALWIALLLGAVASAAVAGALTPRANRFRLRLHFQRLPWAGARSYGLTSVATSAQSLDVALLSAIGSPSAAAMYGAVSRWTQPMSLMAAAFASSAAPFIANSGEIRRAWKRIRRALWFPVAAIVLSGLVAAAAPTAVALLLGDQYEDAAPVLRLLAIATIPSIVSQLCMVTLQSLGHDRAVGRIIPCAVAALLALVCVLAGPHGAIGAGIAYVVMQYSLMVVLVGYVVIVLARSRRNAPHSAGDDAEASGAAANGGMVGGTMVGDAARPKM